MKRLLLLVSISLLVLSCDDDDPQTNLLDGEWSMISYSCGLLGGGQFAEGENVWRINTSAKTLTIVKTSKNILGCVMESGTYDITVTADRFIIGTAGYDYRIDGGSLLLSDMPEVDGPSFTLVKM